MKKILVIIGLTLLVGYIIFAAFYFQKTPDDQVCTHFEVIIADESTDNMVEIDEIEKYIDAKGLNPYGKLIKDINTYNIEKAIISNKLVKSAEVYQTSNGRIRAVVKNRKPIFRVITNSGENYYIDSEGERIPLSRNFSADLPVVTGEVKERFAKTDLLAFIEYITANKFWDAQIEQIVIQPNGEIKLVPRVGNHIIILGEIEGYKEKLNKLESFYEKGLKEVGWNRYSIINLKYDKQVVCTKR